MPLIPFVSSFLTDPNPSLAHFAPAPAENRESAVLILAGGGYQGRSGHEGEGYATAFAERGFHAFVCAYRVAGDRDPLHPAPLEDALAAMKSIRSQASTIGFRPDRIGVIGSSAGGHLAATLATEWGEWGEEFRPDWQLLCYPVIALFGPAAHCGSRVALLGEAGSDEDAGRWSPHQNVKTDTPPAFLWHTWGDEAVIMENSLLYAETLRRSGRAGCSETERLVSAVAEQRPVEGDDPVAEGLRVLRAWMGGR